MVAGNYGASEVMRCSGEYQRRRFEAKGKVGHREAWFD